MSKCRVCKSENLINILSLGNQYLSEFRDDDKKPPRFPLDLVICNECKQVQLKETVPQSLLYTDNYGYRSGINDTMRKHLRNLVCDLESRMYDNLKLGDRVADIGSNDGTLLKYYSPFLRRYGFDLVSKFKNDYQDTGIFFLNEAFGQIHMVKYKIITAISMFYDLDDPVSFMKDLEANLDKKGILVVQQNYLLSMLQINGFDNILHEHVTYNSVASMQKICDRVGLQIFDVQVNDLNGGSFRTYICHKGDYKVKKSVQRQLDYEKGYGLESMECYEDFAKRVDRARDEINGFLEMQEEAGKVTYICGASTRGNTLLQSCLIVPALCPKAIERNPEKYGKKIASVGIPIVSEEDGLSYKPDYLLVLPFFFKAELTRRYAKYIKSGGKLVFPLPKLEIVG
jgi:NDP-4-keto-2,6-dideoxyhexose 3-C-methyltransferase